MRTSVAGPIAAHMQRQAILSRHEDTREALAQIGARGGVAARFRVPMASVKEHQSRTETFARRSILCDASAPQRLARRPYCLGPTVDSDQSECRFHPLQIGVDVGRPCRALNVFCLRNLGINTRRYLGWILNPSRRSFKLRVLVDRQRPMKNVTLDRATALQLDANGTDSALDVAADCHVLRNDAALDLCPIVDLEIRGAHLALDSAEDLRWTFAFDVADDRHVGADARGHSRFCRRF